MGHGCASFRLRWIVAALMLSVCAYGCGDDDSALHFVPSRIAVLSAFPAELAAVLERASVDDTMMIEDHVFRLGRLGGVPVVIGMTGIGLVNAAMTTRMVLDRFNVSGVVVSAVAGSTLQIGAVAVPTAWAFRDGTTYAANPQWLDVATALAASGSVGLDRCTVPLTTTSQESVCMLQQPTIVVGGVGRSTDPFVGKPFPCIPDSGDIYGCDVVTVSPAAALAGERQPPTTLATNPTPVVEDMETAAIAREAAARGLPFIAFRAVSDGAGDPLGLQGFFAQFSAYYRFAAHNAATATVAFLERLAASSRR